MLYNRHFKDGFSGLNVQSRRVVASALTKTEDWRRTMPLLYIDLIEGRSPSETRALLDAVHDAVVEAFQVPPRDRYQVVSTHPAHEIVAWDTGLGIERSPRQVVVHVVSRRRTPAMKEKFYELLASYLDDRCGLDPADLIVSITENGDEDWSFGHGRAQFLTGELK
jgi:phenylpyruvate tautomerase PptA (4-oxalocrotonate tautomerase family)